MTGRLRQFKYDVAFSLLDQDLPKAKEVAGLLRVDLETFLYSGRQDELVGTDGVDAFTAVFQRDARVVVVLGRDAWGSTKWTRVEQTAIKNRGFEEGYEFLVVVPMEGGASVPAWVPRPHIWGDWIRLGSQGLAAIIEIKVGDLGKALRTETAEDVAARLGAERREKQDLEAFLGSEVGVQAANAEFQRLRSLLEARRGSLQLWVGRDSRGTLIVTREYRSITWSWRPTAMNSTVNGEMAIKVWDGVVSPNIASDLRAENVLAGLALRFDRVHDVIGWREKHSDGRFFATEDLVERALKALLLAENGERIRL